MFGLHRALLFTSVVCGAAQLEGVPRILLVDGKPSPHLGIEPRPSVSWAPPAAQLAYQIQVASVASSDPNFDEASLVPGSDKTIADRHSTLIKWHGDSLAPASAYWLRVRTWSKVDDASSGWSSPAKLVTGLHDGFAPGTKPIWTSTADRYGFLRTSFTPHGPIAHAHAFVTAPQEGADAKLLGAYRLFLNGVVAGTGPGRGDAAVHTPYDTVDLTSQLAAGGGDVVLALQGYHTNATCRVMFELHVLYSDGSVAVLGTSSGWDAWGADRLFNPTGDTGGDFHTQPRENIDARAIATGGGTGADMTAWRRAGFVPSQAAGWAAAEEQPPIPPPVLAKPTQPLHVVGGVAPRSVVASEVAGGSKGGSWLADFGSELMGGASLRVRGAREGDTVLLEMGEELSGSTTVLEPMRTKNNYSMVWTLAEGDNTLEQHEYFLFRWAQLTLSGARAAEAGVEGGSSAPPFELTAWVVAYPFDDAAAYFESSNSTLNAVWSLCKNTIRVTSLDTATDSNTRERRPYEADALVTAQSFYALSTDLVWPRHTARYLLTNPTWPTEWRQSMALLALEDFMASGEPSLAVAAADLDGLLVASQRGCIDRSSGLVDFTSCSRQGGAQRDVIDWPQPSRDGYILSNVSSCVNAYAVGALAALGRLAEATGRPELAAQLTNQSLAAPPPRCAPSSSVRKRGFSSTARAAQPPPTRPSTLASTRSPSVWPAGTLRSRPAASARSRRSSAPRGLPAPRTISPSSPRPTCSRRSTRMMRTTARLLSMCWPRAATIAGAT